MRRKDEWIRSVIHTVLMRKTQNANRKELREKTGDEHSYEYAVNKDY